MHDFRGRSVIVTGADSFWHGGQGRSLAMEFGLAGASVAVVDHNDNEVNETAELINEGGGSAIGLPADVTSTSEIERVVKAAEERFGVVDTLVTHPGLYGFGGFNFVHQIDDFWWARVLATNLTAPFVFTRTVLPGMLSAGGGVIIHMNSIAGITGARAGAAYTAAKHGLTGLTRNVAATYGAQGIRCVGIAVGGGTYDGSVPKSQFSAHVDPEGGAASSGGQALGRGYRQLYGDEGFVDGPTPEAAEWYERVFGISVKSGITISQISRLAVFLASDDASFLNGCVVPADGGWAAV